MRVGIRTEALRKVFTSPPPIGGQRGAGFSMARGGRSNARPKHEVVALDGLTLEIQPGEIFGLLGPNGAGKSTTVGILTTRVRPTAGVAWIGDLNVWARRVDVKRLIGVVPQRPNLDFNLTAREILTFHGAYFGLPAAERQSRADALLDRFKLTDRGSQLIYGFSGGMLQRLSIARAMMHDPAVLFLDEPSAGLDPQTRLLLAEMVLDYNARGKTILLTTHNMEEADSLCHRIAIVDHGKVIAIGTPQELKRSIPGGFLLRLQFVAAPAALADALARARRRQRGARPGRRPDRRLRRPRRHADPGDRRSGHLRRHDDSRRAHLGAEPREPVPAPHGKEPAGMNLKTFVAMLARDAHVARRNFVPLLLQTLLQPIMFVFVFGRIMTTAGFMPVEYKSLLLPGIIAISMLFAGVQAVAMPLVAEFQFTKEIEDRLLAPMEIEWLAIEKVVAGMAQALVAGLVVIPTAWLVMGSGLALSRDHLALFFTLALMVSFLSAAGGLALGCSVGQTQIGLMFSLVLAPMIFFGCTYYPWQALAKFPVLQRLVLLNPLVYASEGFRSTLVPGFPHLARGVVVGGLLFFNTLFLALGLRQFRRKAIT